MMLERVAGTGYPDVMSLTNSPLIQRRHALRFHKKLGDKVHVALQQSFVGIAYYGDNCPLRTYHIRAAVLLCLASELRTTTSERKIICLNGWFKH